MYPKYVPELTDLEGKTILHINDAISVQAARAFNVAGSATIVLPDYYPREIFRMHTRMKLWRFTSPDRSANFGNTIWFLKKLDHDVSKHLYTISWVDSFAMLSTRVVAYTSQTTYADKTLEELGLINYSNLLRLDNMLRAYMRENFGDEALDNLRINPYIVIEEDKNLGPYGEKQAAWQSLDSVLSDLAKQASAGGLNLYYDLMPLDNGEFSFKIWTKVRGTDRGSTSSSPLVLSDSEAMITDVHYIEDHTETATFCYVLGYDSGPSQVIESVSNPTLIRNDPFGRIEMVANATDADVPSVLIAAGQQALNGRRSRRIVTAKVVENLSLRYDEHVTYGDLIVTEIEGHQHDVAINAVNTTWNSDGEELDINLLGEDAIGLLLTGAVPTPGIPIPGQINTPPIVDAGPDQEIDSEP